MIHKEIDKSFTKRKNTVNSLPSLNLSPNNNNKSIENDFFKKISKLRQNIKKKNYLLSIIQKKSYKFITEKNFENKIFQVKFSNDKKYYNDLSNIFSKEPDQKKLDNNNMKKSEDNILDPTINDINRKINFDKKLSSFLFNNNNIINNNDITQLKLKQTNNDGANLYTKNNLIRNMKLIFGNKRNNNNIINSYTKKKITEFDSPKIFKDSTISKPNDSELKNVKLNYNNLSLDLNKIRNNKHNLISESNNNNYLYNEIYCEYIKTELDKSNNNNIQINEIHNKLKYEKKIK